MKTIAPQVDKHCRADARFVSELIAATTPMASANEFLEDLAMMLREVDGDASSRYFAVVTPEDAKVLSVVPSASGERRHPELTVNGGVVGGITVIVSDALSDGQVLLFDARQIGADPGVVGLDASRHGMIDMAGGNSPNFSLFQKDASALKAERLFGFKVLRSTEDGWKGCVGGSGYWRADAAFLARL